MLKNKVIVIFGANGLLGKEFVEFCLSYNAIVVGVDISDYMNIKNKSFLYRKCDITNKEDILKLINFLKEKFNRIDSIVNSAYPRNKNYGKRFEEVQYKDFCENVNLHLGGYFLVSQQFAEFFKKQGYGNIINIASIYGVVPPRFEIYKDSEMTMPIEYNVIKHSIISMTKYIVKYYKGCNIKVNCISPGGILNNQPKKFLEKYNEYALNKGMLDKSDINGTLLFLLSDLSKHVNGQNIIVDDGWSL